MLMTDVAENMLASHLNEAGVRVCSYCGQQPHAGPCDPDNIEAAALRASQAKLKASARIEALKLYFKLGGMS